jgi:hypothetical protein
VSTEADKKSGKTRIKFARPFLVDDDYDDGNLLDRKVNTTKKDVEGPSDDNKEGIAKINNEKTKHFMLYSA